MRILVVSSTRNWARWPDIVRALRDRGHEVLLATSPPGTVAEPGTPDVTSVGAQPALPDPWRIPALRARRIIDFLHYRHAKHAASVTWRARAARYAIPRPLRWSVRTTPMPARRLRRWLGALTALEHVTETPAAFDAFLQAAAPDLVAVTPLVQTGTEQDDVVKSARRLGIPSASVAPTWDTFTNKGHLRVLPDAIIVWNDSQRRQVVALHGADPERVIVAGAFPLDRSLAAPPPGERDRFCQRVGLPTDRPLLLFLGSNRTVTPWPQEPTFVRRWLQALRTASSATVREAGVLIRPYPNATDWANVDLSAWHPVHVSRAADPVFDHDARSELETVLHHATAVIGINTSAMIDAAAVGRPVLSILADEFADGQGGSLHFDDLRPENGGCLTLARTLDEHVAQLTSVLSGHDESAARRERFVASFARPLGRDVPAATRVAEALERAAARGVVQAPPPQRPLARALLWPVAVALTAATRFRHGGHLRDRPPDT